MSKTTARALDAAGLQDAVHDGRVRMLDVRTPPGTRPCSSRVVLISRLV